MIITHTEADPSIGFESSVGCDHHDGWGFEGILLWKDEFAPVETIFVGCVGGTFNDVVPFE